MLLELLIAIMVGVVLVVLGVQLVLSGIGSIDYSKTRNEGLGLAQEGLETVRVIVRGNDAGSQGWNRLYLPPDGTGTSSTSKGLSNPYHPTLSGGVWRLASGAENITVGNEIFMRQVFIENVCRNNTTGAIASVAPCIANSTDDPSTQKVTVVVSQAGSPDVQFSSYFTRFGNEVTAQANWSGGLNNGPFPATSTSLSTYGQNTDTANLDLDTGIRLQAN